MVVSPEHIGQAAFDRLDEPLQGVVIAFTEKFGERQASGFHRKADTDAVAGRTNTQP